MQLFQVVVIMKESLHAAIDGGEIKRRRHRDRGCDLPGLEREKTRVASRHHQQQIIRRRDAISTHDIFENHRDDAALRTGDDLLPFEIGQRLELRLANRVVRIPSRGRRRRS